MGRLVQFGALKEAVRLRYDLPAYGTNTYVSSDNISRTVNDSLQAFYAMLMEAYGEGYFERYDDLSTQPGVELTSTPVGFFKTVRVLWLRGPNYVVSVKRAQPEDMRLSAFVYDWTQVFPRYRLDGSTLHWLPTPLQAYPIRLFYIWMPPDLAVDTDTFDAGPNWDEWIVLDTCSRIAEREDQDAAKWIGLRGVVEERIRSQAPDRYEGQALQVRDAMGMRAGRRRYGDAEMRDMLTNDWWKP